MNKNKCNVCGIKLSSWNDIFIIYQNKYYCVECYENFFNKKVIVNCKN